MPPGKTTSSNSLSKGAMAEARVSQLWFWEGYYSRSGVDLRRHYHPEPLQVTDLDLVAIDVSPSLQLNKTIGECKTGTGRSAPKPLDRIIWLRGLMELVGAGSAELTSGIEPSSRARDLAYGLGVRAQSLKDIERREDAIGIGEVENLGSQGPFAAELRNRVHKICAADPDLERAFWFLRADVWFAEPITACKRTIGLYRQLSRKWTPSVDDDDQLALRWLLAESVSVLVLNMVAVASGSIVQDRTLFGRGVNEQLSAGVASADALRRIARDVDKFVGGLLTAAGASESVRADAMGAIHPEPPEWTEPFIETLVRLGQDAPSAQALPRQLDHMVFERMVNHREVRPAAVSRLRMEDQRTGRQARVVAAFLRGQVAEIEAVDKALTTALPSGDQESQADNGKGGAQVSLLDE